MCVLGPQTKVDGRKFSSYTGRVRLDTFKTFHLFCTVLKICSILILVKAYVIKPVEDHVQYRINLITSTESLYDAIFYLLSKTDCDVFFKSCRPTLLNAFVRDLKINWDSFVVYPFYIHTYSFKFPLFSFRCSCQFVAIFSV